MNRRRRARAFAAGAPAARARGAVSGGDAPRHRRVRHRRGSSASAWSRRARRANSCCCARPTASWRSALFVDAAALANLERHDPAARLDDRNFSDFCLAVEGVSHFVYVALAAARQRPVSQLELELQAEVDKFVCCCLLLTRSPEGLRQPAPPAVTAMSPTRTIWTPTNASAIAPRISTPAATRRRSSTGSSRASRPIAMLAEVRRFYRMDLPDEAGAHRAARLIAAGVAAGARGRASAINDAAAPRSGRAARQQVDQLHPPPSP